MSAMRPLSVEVFRNGTVPRDALFDAEVSLQRINRMFGGISIVGLTRTLGVYTNAEGRVDPYRTLWSDLAADINIVLSDKRIIESRQEERIINPIGIALNDRVTRGLRVAVVDSEYGDVADTVAHEFGHLVDMGHCYLEKCTMHAFQSEKNDQVLCIACRRLMGRNILRNAARNRKHLESVK